MVLFWLGLTLGCTDKTATDDSGSDSGSETATETDTSGDSDSSGDCPTGPGFVEGVLLGSDILPLSSGKVRLFDSTGSDEKVSSNVNSDGSYRVVYGGPGDYIIRGEYSTCVGDDIPVTICGDQTIYLNITLDCAP